MQSIIRAPGERKNRPSRLSHRPRLEYLEDRIVPSFADGNGAVILNVTSQNSGTQIVLTFDGPLNATPANPLQSPTNAANYSIQVPAANAQLVTSSTSSVTILSAVYNPATFQVTLNLATPLTAGTFYRVFVNGTASADNTSTPGLIDSNQNPIDGDFDDTASGNFYALFAWTTSATPLQFSDALGNQITLTLAGPGQLQAWRMLNGSFNALALAAQANETAGAVQQMSVVGGTLGTTTLTGTVAFATGNSVVVSSPIAGQGIDFTNNLPAYFQLNPAPPPLPTAPIVATGNNLPYTLQIQQVTATLPAVQSPVFAQDNVAGSAFNGYWLLFGGRTNGLHTFTGNNDFPPQDMNEDIIVINPSTFQVWTKAWSATNVTATMSQPLYSTNQQAFQEGDNLFTAGGYGAPDLGGGNFGSYVTYPTLTAMSVDGMINAVVNNGDVVALSHIQQITDSRVQDTGGEMEMLGNQAFLVVGQDFEGQYFNNTATQTYQDEIRSFQINYVPTTPGSLSISNYVAQNDQVNLRRRDYTLTPIIQPTLQPALDLLGGVFTPGPFNDPVAGQGYRQPITITGPGQTSISSYQQFFSQYSAANVGLFDAGTGSMYTLLFGGIGIYNYNFATGQLTADTGLPFVNDVTTLSTNSSGTMQEFIMPSQLPGFYGAEARFFTNPALPQYSNGVVQLNQISQPITLGYIYGGIVSTVAETTDQTTQTKASNVAFRITLVPAPTATLSSTVSNPTGENPIPITATFSQPVTGLTAAKIATTNATVGNVQPVNPTGGFATTWTFTLTPTAPGPVTAIVTANAAQNSGGTGNTGSNTFSVNYQPVAQTVGVYNPSNASWFLRNSNSAGPPDFSFAFGAQSWYPITGDWDGDGVTTIGVVDLSTETWYLRNSNSGGLPSYTPFKFGAPGWIPVVGDWTGTGHDGIGVVDPSTGAWYLRNEISAGLPDAGNFQFGAPGWIPVTGDWTGVGHAGVGMFNASSATWYLRTELSSGPPDANPGSAPFSYGAPGWRPVVGDWSGQGKTTIGVVNLSTETWYLRNSNSPGAPSFQPFAYGAPGWLPVAGQWAPVLAQLAATGTQKSVIKNPVLTNTQLQAAVQGALNLLRADGIAPNVLAALSNIQFSVGTLTGSQLALSYLGAGKVVVDASADGFGWFVDQTPLANEEFAQSAGALVAKPNSAASGHMDLLTVLLHEMGHFEGWTELDPRLHPNSLMALTLGAGTRRTSDIDEVFGN